MGQSIDQMILPTPRQTEEETDAREATARLEDTCHAERVLRALRAVGYGPLRRIEVTVRAGVIILQGRVPSYYMKQIAQATALAVPGTDQLRNDLEVGRPG